MGVAMDWRLLTREQKRACFAARQREVERFERQTQEQPTTEWQWKIFDIRLVGRYGEVRGRYWLQNLVRPGEYHSVALESWEYYDQETGQILPEYRWLEEAVEKERERLERLYDRMVEEIHRGRDAAEKQALTKIRAADSETRRRSLMLREVESGERDSYPYKSSSW